MQNEGLGVLLGTLFLILGDLVAPNGFHNRLFWILDAVWAPFWEAFGCPGGVWEVIWHLFGALWEVFGGCFRVLRRKSSNCEKCCFT